MEKIIVPLPLEEGLTLLVEVTPQAGSSNKVGEENPQFFNKTRELGEALRVIRPLVEKVIEPLKALSPPPSRMEIQFGFSIGQKAEVILNQEPRESHIRVNLVFETPGKGANS